MPRLITAEERALIAAGSLNVHGRCLVLSVDGVWRDTGALAVPGHTELLDFFNGAVGNLGIDQPVESCTINLERALKLYTGGNTPAAIVSLAPSVVTSPANRRTNGTYAPLIAPGRHVLVQLAVVAPGAAVADADWRSVFRGIVDSVSWPNNEIVLTCRDLGAILLSHQIKDKHTYGTTAGQPLQDVLRAMLDYEGFTTVPLVVEGDPEFFIPTYEQDVGSLLDAMRSLAVTQRGWDLRYRWRGAAGTAGVHELVLCDVPRTKTVADWTLGPDEYQDVRDINTSMLEVRNYIRVAYFDTALNAPSKVEAKDLDSIAQYGEQFGEISEDNTSQINTNAEAGRLANIAVSDMSSVGLDHSVSEVGLWAVELNDTIEFAPNEEHYDELQTLAVVGIDWELSNAHYESTFRTRGKPAGAFAGWLNRLKPTQPGQTPSPGGTITIVPVISAKVRPDLSSEDTVWIAYSMSAPGHTTKMRGRINNGPWSDLTGLLPRTIDGLLTFPRTPNAQVLDLYAVSDDGTESGGLSISMPGSSPGQPVVVLAVNRYGSLCTAGKKAQLTLLLQFPGPLPDGWEVNATDLEAPPYSSPQQVITSDGTLQDVTMNIQLSGWGRDTNNAHTYQVNWNVLSSTGAGIMSGVAEVVGDALTNTCP